MSGILEGRRKLWLLRGAGLLVGALAVLLVPESWLFVGESSVRVDSRAGEVRYACPMFCVLMDELPANERCPVCGMVLEPVVDQATLHRYERAMSGVVGARLEERPLEVVLRQIGEVDYDETLLSSVTARVGGVLERVHVQETWAVVEEGQLLVEIDSPMLFSAQGDYLVAWSAAGRPASPEDATGPEVGALRSTRARLLNLGLGEPELAALRQQGVPLDPVGLRAPRGGVVVRRQVVEGEGVMAGQELYTIADLSRVWILFEAFEHELSKVLPGQTVELRTETSPGELLHGTVAAVDPVIDRDRRTARVRVIADNPIGDFGRRRYLPGQRVDVRIQARLGRRGQVVLPGPDPAEPYSEVPPLLAIPREAVLRTGERNVAFVLYEEIDAPAGAAEGGARARSYELDPEQLPERVGYEMVQLRLGPKARAVGVEGSRWYYPVLGVVPQPEVVGLQRLSPGQVIVADGAFLLDSQAQLAGRPSLLFPEGSRASGVDPHADH